jgi:hypothetical protein
MINLKRFDAAMLSWAVAYPSLSRDRRAINILMVFLEMLVVGRIVFDAVGGRLEWAGTFAIALMVLMGFHVFFNALIGLAGAVQTSHSKRSDIG